MSNYPPGVTGNEIQIGGADYENERTMRFDKVCPECEVPIVKGTEVTVQAHRHDLWLICPHCEQVVDLDEDEWESIDRSR